MEGIVENAVDSSELSSWEDDIRSLLIEFILNQRSRLTARSYFKEILWFFHYLSPEREVSRHTLVHVQQAHVVLFRKDLEQKKYASPTIVRKLAASLSKKYTFSDKDPGFWLSLSVKFGPVIGGIFPISFSSIKHY